MGCHSSMPLNVKITMPSPDLDRRLVIARRQLLDAWKAQDSAELERANAELCAILAEIRARGEFGIRSLYSGDQDRAARKNNPPPAHLRPRDYRVVGKPNPEILIPLGFEKFLTEGAVVESTRGRSYTVRRRNDGRLVWELRT